MRYFHPVSLALMTVVLSGAVAAAPKTSKSEKTPILISGFNSNLSGEEYTKVCDSAIESAKAQFRILEADTSKATLQSVFGQFDDIARSMQQVQQSWHMKAVHPDESIRDAASDCSVKYSALFSDFNVSTKPADSTVLVR